MYFYSIVEFMKNSAHDSMNRSINDSIGGSTDDWFAKMIERASFTGDLTAKVISPAEIYQESNVDELFIGRLDCVYHP